MAGISAIGWNNESVEKLFSERNFQISREKNEEEEGILGSKYVADWRIFRSRKMEIAVER